jgi:hypothetical protein
MTEQEKHAYCVTFLEGLNLPSNGIATFGNGIRIRQYEAALGSFKHWRTHDRITVVSSPSFRKSEDTEIFYAIIRCIEIGELERGDDE